MSSRGRWLVAGAGAGAGAGMKVCGDDRSAQHQSTNRNARGYLEVDISQP